MPIKGLHFGDSGTHGDIGSCLHLVARSDGSNKENFQVSSPLSVEININNNNDGIGPEFTDEVVITTGSGAQKKVLAIIDVHGNLRIAGEVKTGQTFDTHSL